MTAPLLAKLYQGISANLPQPTQTSASTAHVPTSQDSQTQEAPTHPYAKAKSALDGLVQQFSGSQQCFLRSVHRFAQSRIESDLQGLQDRLSTEVKTSLGQGIDFPTLETTLKGDPELQAHVTSASARDTLVHETLAPFRYQYTEQRFAHQQCYLSHQFLSNLLTPSDPLVLASQQKLTEAQTQRRSTFGLTLQQQTQEEQNWLGDAQAIQENKIATLKDALVSLHQDYAQADSIQKASLLTRAVPLMENFKKTDAPTAELFLDNLDW